MCNQTTVDNPELERDLVEIFASEGIEAEAHGECIHSVVTVPLADVNKGYVIGRAAREGFEVFAEDTHELTLTGRKDALREEWRDAA